MNPRFHTELGDELDALAHKHSLRSCPALVSADRVSGTLGKDSVVSFCSNDYLGLAADDRVNRALSEAALTYGTGSSGSRLVSGDHPAHRSLEISLSGLVDMPASLLFSTGYQANVGVLTALAGPDDLIVSDAANHASIIDGCRLSRAKIAIFPHNDVAVAQEIISQPGPFRRRILVTESIFSMDGDSARLPDLERIASANDALFVVDDAHAIGILGPSGSGLCRALGLRPDFLIGTLGKAFGVAGGFVCSSRPGRDFLVNRARSFIYSTAPPPALAAAAAAALQILAQNDGDELRSILHRNVALLCHGLGFDPRWREQHPGAIVPVVLGSAAAALDTALALLEKGLFVQPIRPPTVPADTARLRITLSARHTPEQIAHLASALRPLLPANRHPR